jgi:hypothetical protein
MKRQRAEDEKQTDRAPSMSEKKRDKQERGKGTEANDEDGEALSGQSRGSGSSTLHKFPGGKGLVADPFKGEVTLLTYTDRSAPSRFSDPITFGELWALSRG